MPFVLFVCTANINRSPMAEAIFKQHISTLPDRDLWQVESAGTWALDGGDVSSKAQKVLADRGIELINHRARMVTADMIRSSDIILTMERGQKEALQFEFKEAAGRIFLISEISGYPLDVIDPVGGSLIEYKATVDELVDLIDKGFDRICMLARRNASR